MAHYWLKVLYFFLIKICSHVLKTRNKILFGATSWSNFLIILHKFSIEWVRRPSVFFFCWSNLVVILEVWEESESCWNTKSSSHKFSNKDILKYSIISWCISELTFVETILSILELYAVMQPHTMTEVTNLTECFKYFLSKS